MAVQCPLPLASVEVVELAGSSAGPSSKVLHHAASRCSFCRLWGGGTMTGSAVSGGQTVTSACFHQGGQVWVADSPHA